VLIHGAGGGVGHLAVQIAKARGAYVVGTASAAKHDFVRSLGADELIDHQTCDFAAVAGDLDVVLDSLGGEIARRVGHRVGYDNPSQFSREYRRQFGAPPSVDAVRMRGGAGPAAAALP
jgi:NADPH:quinone reductase-like Zn-dependent oxidoreductase